jgi:thymidylate synthase (FAD)
MIEGVKDAEELLAYVARVSNPSNQMNAETAPRLIKYLMKNSHWSPFECIHVTMEIKTTRDIARQILRHRSLTFQEFSTRYAQVTDMATPREFRLQDKKNRQNSIDVDDSFSYQAAVWNTDQKKVLATALEAYNRALDMGVAKEVARSVLPEGLTMSTLYASGSLRSWIHYCDLRRGNGTQKEHKEIAEMCWEIISSSFPSVRDAKVAIEEEARRTLEEKFNAMLIERAERDEYGSYVVRVS